MGGNSGGVTLGRVIGVEVEGRSTFNGVDGISSKSCGPLDLKGVLTLDVRRSRNEGVLGVAMPTPLSLVTLIEDAFSEVVTLEGWLCSVMVGTVEMGSCLEVVNCEIGSCCCRAR